MAGACVLIADDEFLIGLDIELSVRDAGGTVLGPYVTLAEAEKAAACEKIDVAVLDVRVGPGMTSAPLAGTLQDRGIPFLFCTGHHLPNEMQERFGSHIVMTKPVQHDALIKTLRRLLARL